MLCIHVALLEIFYFLLLNKLVLFFSQYYYNKHPYSLVRYICTHNTLDQSTSMLCIHVALLELFYFLLLNKLVLFFSLYYYNKHPYSLVRYTAELCMHTYFSQNKFLQIVEYFSLMQLDSSCYIYIGLSTLHLE